MPDLPRHLSGYLANPMVQARASVPALLSAAAWLKGGDPVDAWERSIGDAALLSEAVAPRRLPELSRRTVDGDLSAAHELAEFFAAASTCDHGGFGAEVAPWVAQVRSEAGLAQLALQALLADGEEEARRALMVLLLMWPTARRSEVSVFGGRGGTRPMMSQDRRVTVGASRGCLVEPASVVDELVSAAFARADHGSTWSHGFRPPMSARVVLAAEGLLETHHADRGRIVRRRPRGPSGGGTVDPTGSGRHQVLPGCIGVPGTGGSPPVRDRSLCRRGIR